MFSNPDTVCLTWWNKETFGEIWNALINSEASFALTLLLVPVSVSLWPWASSQGTQWHPEPSPGSTDSSTASVPAELCLCCTAISLHSTSFHPLFPLFILPKQAEKLQVTVWLSEGILKFNLQLTHHYFGCNLVRHQPASGAAQPSASWSGFSLWDAYIAPLPGSHYIKISKPKNSPFQLSPSGLNRWLKTNKQINKTLRKKNKT